MADKRVYQDWYRRSLQAERIVADPSIPLWQKAHRVGNCYAEVELQGLKKKHRQKILSSLANVNAILALYTIESFDDYQHIDSQHLREILVLFRALALPSSPQ